jgi:hypothetical protein
MTKIKGWREISARTYMSEKRLINITEISPKEYIVVLVEGLSAEILRHFKTKRSAMRFMFNYMKIAQPKRVI